MKQKELLKYLKSKKVVNVYVGVMFHQHDIDYIKTSKKQVIEYITSCNHNEDIQASLFYAQDGKNIFNLYIG